MVTPIDKRPKAVKFSMSMTPQAYGAVTKAMRTTGMSRARQIETWVRDSPEAMRYIAKVEEPSDDIRSFKMATIRRYYESQ